MSISASSAFAAERLEICSQIKFESKDNTCPIKIDNKCISANIRTYFSSISNITAKEYE